jgi:hypothetical protein
MGFATISQREHVNSKGFFTNKSASLGLDHQHSQQIYVEMRIPMLFDFIISNDNFP